MTDFGLSLPDIGSLAHVAQTIQLAIAPVFLLAAIGSILNVLSGRLARTVDRSRILQSRSADDEKGAARSAVELRALDTRVKLISDAVFLCVASAITVCVVVAVMFVARLVGFPLGDLIALLFIVAMLLLVAGLILFSIEVRVATRAIQAQRL